MSIRVNDFTISPRTDGIAGNVMDGTQGDDDNTTDIFKSYLTGNDIINGYGGADNLTGEDGDDTIDGGDEDDDIYGGDGNDNLVGGDGNDLIKGGEGADTTYGGEGVDFIYGGAGSDRINGGEGRDVLRGDEGADVLIGGFGSDKIYVEDFDGESANGNEVNAPGDNSDTENADDIDTVVLKDLSGIAQETMNHIAENAASYEFNEFNKTYTITFKERNFDFLVKSATSESYANIFNMEVVELNFESGVQFVSAFENRNLTIDADDNIVEIFKPEGYDIDSIEGDDRFGLPLLDMSDLTIGYNVLVYDIMPLLSSSGVAQDDQGNYIFDFRRTDTDQTMSYGFQSFEAINFAKLKLSAEQGEFVSSAFDSGYGASHVVQTGETGAIDEPAVSFEEFGADLTLFDGLKALYDDGLIEGNMMVTEDETYTIKLSPDLHDVELSASDGMNITLNNTKQLIIDKEMALALYDNSGVPFEPFVMPQTGLLADKIYAPVVSFEKFNDLSEGAHAIYDDLAAIIFFDNPFEPVVTQNADGTYTLKAKDIDYTFHFNVTFSTPKLFINTREFIISADTAQYLMDSSSDLGLIWP
ncbi:MAG: calcium-binding protein [Pseudomonadota bacterium]